LKIKIFIRTKDSAVQCDVSIGEENKIINDKCFNLNMSSWKELVKCTCS